jgi:hypothetical protein
MYFVFETTLQGSRKDIVLAKIQEHPPKTQPHWWDCVMLTAPLPLITFEVTTTPLPDILFTGSIFDLYSSRVIEILSKAGVLFEFFPAHIVNQFKQTVPNAEYRIFHLLEKYPGIDLSLSNIDDESMEIRRLVIADEYLQVKKLFFRVKGLEEIVLIHQELKELFDAHGITGCSYTPLNEYRSGIRFYFEQRKDR